LPGPIIAGAQPELRLPCGEKIPGDATYREFDHHAHWLVAEFGWQKIAEYVMAWIEQVVPMERASETV